MTFDNVLTFGITILEIDITLSICWLSVCLGIEHNYGKMGYYKEFGIGKRFAMDGSKWLKE